MGTKRPSWTLFDTLINMSMSDHKLQPGGKVSRDPSPRPAITVRSEQERDGLREENWRKENEAEKMRDKTRYRDMDAPDRYCEGDRSPGPRSREGEREMWERDRRKEDGRSRNGKLLLNVEKETRELERRAKKGGTFPRFKKAVTSPDRRLMSVTEMGEERGERRKKDRTKRAETDAWEQERERERDEVRSRVKEEGKTTARRYMEHEKVRQRERYQESDIRFQDSRREVADSWDRRERMREKPMLDMGERMMRMAFPHRRKEIENYGDRKESENAQRREKRRDIRSEGDDERELRRERVRDSDGEDLICHYSRSEGDNKTARERDRERQRYRARDREREVDRSRGERAEDDHERYRDGDRRAARPADREGKESWRDLDNRGDRKENDQYRECKHGRNGKRKERQADTRRVDGTGRISRSPTQQAPGVPPRAQSSGEWSSDPDSEMRYRRDRGRYEDQESRREGMFEREGDRERPRDPERTADKRQIRNERQESDKGEKTGSMPEQRRMWLEPQRGKNSKGKFIDGERHTGWKQQRGEEETSMESQAERGRDGWRIKKEPDERCLEQSSSKQSQGGRNEYREDTEREREGVSIDEEKVGEIWRDKGEKEHLSDSDGGIEESSQRDEGEDVIDDIEENDREEESGSDYWARYESEGGSEAGWKKERDKMLAPEDGIVTVSSGGEDEREDTEEEFRDCQEFQEGGAQSPAGFKGYERDQKREEEQTTGDEETADGEEKQPKYVFVVGKTLPQSQDIKISPWQADQIGEVERNDPNLETDRHLSGNATQQPQDDLHQILNRNDEHPVINNQDTESEHKVQREERLSKGQEAEGNIQSRAPSDIHDTESSEEMRSKVKNLYYGLGITKRDSKTERLLKEWREKNKELTGKEGMQASFSQSDFDRLQPILDQINTGALSPEEVEAIRIRLSGTWSMSEEPKRRSQAPHLRWAKDVVREILGHSEEEPSTEALDNQPVANQSEISNTKQQEEVAEETREVPVIKLSMDEEDLEPELEELFDVRGMGQSQARIHADQFTVMHVVTRTHTHADTALDSERKEDHSVDKKTFEPSGQVQLGESDIKVTISEAGDNEANLTGREKGEEEEEMYLNADNTLYKPNSCPILYYDSDSEVLCPSNEGESQGVEYGRDESEERRQGEEPEEMGTAVEVTKMVVTEPTEGEGGVEGQRQVENLPSSCSLGSKAPSRRNGLRKTAQRRSLGVEEEEEEKKEGVGRDRRTRIFYATDDEDDRSKSWGEVGLRVLLGTIEKRRKNSKFFSAAQLYQQYSEAAQNFEILRQARSETLSVCEDTTSSPLPSPPPARRPLPPVPPPLHFHTGSIQSLPLPERPRGERRASSPRLSISQSSSLWRDLPGVRGNAELEELTDDQRRLQEVRFEVVTSEASYCRSLEIVVNHFVKSKQLGMLLTTQERNWLFSRLVDVRAISHSFLSKLEERVESDVMHFTVCDIISTQCPLFRKAYVPYLTNQSYQDATYQRLMNENPRFKMVVEKIERSSVCERLPLRSFLVLPFQRITRLKLLVQNIVKRTTPGTEEATQAIKALKHLEKIIQEGNDSITQMKSIESLVSLNSKVDFECRTLPLISQSRRLVREGPVTELMDFSLKDTERSVYLHLFTDYLLLSLPKEGGRFTVIDHCPVSELRVENCRVKLHSLQKNLFRLHMTHKSLLLRTDAQSDKLRWISALSRPHPEIDFSAAQDFEQMQCIRAFVAQQPDELSLEKAEVILVHQESSDHWVEGTRLSDRQRGWMPKSHLETIMSSRVKKRNLLDALKLTAAKAAV